jgi:cytoskeletal protein CcmA (bactofilin family)
MIRQIVCPRSLSAGLLSCFVLLGTAIADQSRERTQFGHSISIAPGEEVSEATCFGCSIRVRGHVDGDVTAFGGSVVLEDQGEVNGDASVFGGDLRLDKATKVGGSVSVFGGRIRRDPEATVGGDVTNMGGRGWVLLIFLMPIIFLGAVIAFIVWLIRRLLRPSVPAAA